MVEVTALIGFVTAINFVLGPDGSLFAPYLRPSLELVPVQPLYQATSLSC